jgi:hypothetical protein
MKYVNVLETLEEDIHNLEEQLKSKEAIRDELSKETIPAMLSENGLDELKLSNGKRLSIKEDLYVTLPKNETGRKSVLNWLRNNGGADLIKEDMVIETPPDEVKTFLALRGVTYSQELAVNGNSLKAWFKRKLGLAKGSIQEIQLDSVPKEANLYIDRRVEIK